MALSALVAGAGLLAAPAAFAATPQAGGQAQVVGTSGAPLRIRVGPGTAYRAVAETGAGRTVAVLAGPVRDPQGRTWYQVRASGVAGWSVATYLDGVGAPAQQPQAAPAAQRLSPAPQPQPQAQASSRGNAIAGLAMRYVGYRYRFGGSSPSGFDCSGFVYYVYNASGVGLARNMYAQYASGSHISSNNLQPGDVLFFSNTYKRGLSHVGIYIGGGRFVNAENPSTGVRVSQLWSSYWASHYTGAVRPR